MLDMEPQGLSFPNWPTFGLYEDSMKFVMEKSANNQSVAVATLIETRGGSPRPIGTQMAFTSDDMTGYFSGGCVEADIALHARKTLADTQPRLLVYGEKSKFRDIKLPCGASITVAIEMLVPGDHALKAYARLRTAREVAIWITDGVKRWVGSDISDFEGVQHDIAAIAHSSGVDAGRHIGTSYWVRYRPPVRLILIGSDPVTLALARLSKEAEFEVILNRRSGPHEAPPVDVQIYSRESPEEVCAGLVLDDRTAIVFADHDFESNKNLIANLLNSTVGYVGMIGAQRQRPAKEHFLRARGLGDPQIAKFKSPAGTGTGKSTPIAIAISVVAEIITTMSK